MRWRETRESGTQDCATPRLAPLRLRLLLSLLHQAGPPGFVLAERSHLGAGGQARPTPRRRARRGPRQRERARRGGAGEAAHGRRRYTMNTPRGGRGLRAERGAAAAPQDGARLRRERSSRPTRASGTRSRSSRARCSRSSASSASPGCCWPEEYGGSGLSHPRLGDRDGGAGPGGRGGGALRSPRTTASARPTSTSPAARSRSSRSCRPSPAARRWAAGGSPSPARARTPAARARPRCATAATGS